MTSRRRPSALQPVAALWLVVIVALAGLVAAPSVAGASVTFETPTASSKLGVSLTFSIRFSSPATPSRVELLRHAPATGNDPAAVPSDFVEDADVAPDGGQFIATVVDVGSVLPNTTFLYRFRVTTADGVTVSDEQRFTVVDERFTWKVRQGARIRLHWYQGDDAFADRALKVGDGGLARAMDLLGVTETDPVDFFVYADEASFRQAMGPGVRENVGGRAVPQIRTLFGLIAPGDINSDWIEHVIPHELTHLVFATASDNPYHFPPKWLNEGLAVYMEPGGYSIDWRARVEASGKAGTLIPLDGLTLSYPADRDGFFLGYAESVSAVDFFVRQYGKPTLVKLIRSYATGLSDDAAFRAAIGTDTVGFNAAWLAEMGGKATGALGPQPPPMGPLPSDWNVSTPAPGLPAVPAGNVPAARSGSDLLLPIGALALTGIVLIVVGIALTRRRLRPGPPGPPTVPGPPPW